MLRPLQKAFLGALLQTAGNITRAASLVPISIKSHYDWLKAEADLPIEEAEYTYSFHEAKQQSYEVLEAEAIRRAHDGVRKPVVSMGRVVMVQKRDDKGNPEWYDFTDPKTKKKERRPVLVPLEEISYSDSLMGLLLRGNISEKYRDKADVNAMHTGSVNITITSDDERL